MEYIYESVEKMRAMLNTAQPPPSTEQMQQLLRLLHQTLLANKLRYVYVILSMKVCKFYVKVKKLK